MNPDQSASLIELNTPQGTGKPVFLLYGMRWMTSPPLHLKKPYTWGPDADVRHFELRDDPWPVTIDLFEIAAPSPPADLQAPLKAALEELSSEGSLVSWFMFDGAFGDIQTLFSTDWDAASTYGLAMKQGPTQLALEPAVWESEEWKKKVAAAGAYLDQLIPELRATRAEQ